MKIEVRQTEEGRAKTRQREILTAKTDFEERKGEEKTKGKTDWKTISEEDKQGKDRGRRTDSADVTRENRLEDTQ